MTKFQKKKCLEAAEQKTSKLLVVVCCCKTVAILQNDSQPHWMRCMQGHAAANIMPVIASNRIGTETEGDSFMTFYGSSFITDETGALAAEADRESETVLTATFDLDAIARKRREWGVFRDRRPEMYETLLSHGK